MRKIGLMLGFLCAAGRGATVAPLWARGYTVMPEPQVVKLGAGDFEFEDAWGLEVAGVGADDVAVETLRQELNQRFGLRLGEGRRGTSVLRLTVAANSVSTGEAQDRNRPALEEQAYKIDLSREGVQIAANAPAGLFYGVVTLVQLVKPQGGVFLLPEGHIEDWPDLGQRHIYWDDAHHLDRMEAIKHAIRQAALFKINGIAIKLEGHFQYKSAPALVEPQALAPGELQELTRYGLRYHVQVIPYLDSPAHIAFILKHPEYAKLRAFPDSNYELCATNPDSYKLLFGMFQDLLDANPGVSYFYLSTDEPYYIGMADNAQCREAPRAKELGSVGKLLAEFIAKTANYLHDRGRTVVFWGEFPLKVDDIAALPAHLVNGEVYGPEFDRAFRKHGIRQMIYTSSEGDESLFPDYFPLPASRRVHESRGASRRVADTFRKISFDSSRRDAELVGMVNAGWADMGLHAETFWLGYAAAGAAAWHPGSPDPAETMATFYPLFYGHGVTNMNRVYELMSTQAQFWTDSWDRVASTARKPIWGNSDAIFTPPHPAHDQSLPLPPAPGPDLAYDSAWAKENAKRVELAAEFLLENDELLGLLHGNLTRAELNRYNLEVYLSIAHLYRQNLEMLGAIAHMDRLLWGAAEDARKEKVNDAVEKVDEALELARAVRDARNRALGDATATWHKTWWPRVAAASGRRFLHELDDVKDHLPDRTVDMSYLVYRELLLPLGEWVDEVRAARNRYAQAHNLPARDDRLDWKDLAAVEKNTIATIPLE